jgi:glycosyltransferase involved in cell wall biosynthesis
MIVIVPTNRTERIPHIVRQWRAQTYTAAELCICPAPDMIVPIPSGVTVLQPTSSIGEARNVGLSYARGRGHEWAVFWDDDNHHGRDYLAEVAREMAGPWDVLSKGLAFVRHDSGLWLYSSRLKFFPGHSTSARVAACVEFPEWSLAEDVEWSKRMQARGARAKHLPPWGLVYTRTNPAEHAYCAEEVEFLRAHGPARRLGQIADTCADVPADWSGAELVGAKDADVFASLERRCRGVRASL